ncbi:MAG TPA: ABC transporter ATP-binding protein [Stellaceae bacterium]|nr:ABC transporter ATP-binding protein [Stellaceae bacterium]
MIKLSATGIEKQMGTLPVLKGISVSLNEGEVVALLGHSGSGKTTLLRSFAGLETPDSGTIELEGKTIFDAARGINLPPEKRGLGFVFQSYALWPHRTVVENVGYGLKLRGVPKAEIDSRTKDVLGRLGLGALGERYPHQLSGGQQQRVALARALAYRPPVLLLDEPLSNLDAKLREEARSWLRELIKQTGLSALYVTHDQVEALAVSDRILFLHNGGIEQHGTPEEMYEQPNTALSAVFMGSNNRIDGTIRVVDGKTMLMGEGWSLPGRAMNHMSDGAPASGYVRLERTRIGTTAGAGTLTLDLVSTLYLGERFEYLFEGHGMRLRAWGPTRLPATRQDISILPEDLWLFAR